MLGLFSPRRSLQITMGICLLTVTGCQQVSLLRSEAPSQPQKPPAKKLQPGPFATKGLSDQQSAEACLATGIELEGSGYDHEAIVAYERALGFDSKQPGLAFSLARLHAKVGTKERALHYFQAALAERPDNPEVLGDFGYFLYEQRDFAGAEQQLTRALKVQPDNKRNRTNLAMVLYAGNRIPESLKAFEQAAGRAAARFNLAVLLARDGRVAESQQFNREALMFDPQMPEALAFAEWLNDGGSQQPAMNSSPSGTAAISLSN
jgi:Flp pilus assembly protein TadD